MEHFLAHSLDDVNGRERDALRRWTTWEHRKVQETLIWGVPPDRETRRMISLLDSALSRGTLPAEVPLFRYDELARFNVSSFAELKKLEGTVIDCPGFLATGVNHGTATQGGDVLVRVVTPPGTKALYLEPITASPGQGEILIARGYLMSIRAVHRGNDGKPLVVVDLVRR